jgi:hypothetical protein
MMTIPFHKLFDPTSFYAQIRAGEFGGRKNEDGQWVL